MKTDKTNRLAAVTPEVYLKMGESHIGTDREISLADVAEVQKTVNGHTSSWLKILGYGNTWVQSDRFRKTCVNHSENVPPLYLLLKDHKQVGEGELPKTRPVCSSQQGMNHQLSNLISEFLEPVAEASNISAKVASSEDLLSQLDKLNSKLKSMCKSKLMSSQLSSELDDIVLLGAYAIALYPSLNKEILAEVVSEAVAKSDLNINGTDCREMGRYIFLNMTEAEQKA